jgi:hypothetical protein
MLQSARPIRHREPPESVERRPSLQTGFGGVAIQGSVGRARCCPGSLRPGLDPGVAMTAVSIPLAR